MQTKQTQGSTAVFSSSFNPNIHLVLCAGGCGRLSTYRYCRVCEIKR